VFGKQRLIIDDSLDVFAVHGVGGMLGSTLLSVFAAASLGGVGFAERMNFPRQLGAQLLAIAAAALWSAGITFVLVRALRPVTGLRSMRNASSTGSISPRMANAPTITRGDYEYTGRSGVPYSISCIVGR
jgi:Amt family ammonium transporter